MTGIDYSVNDLNTIIGGNMLQQHGAGKIRSIITDSRKAVNTDEAVFFAIKGARNDGHLYLEDLHKKGVRNFVVSKNSDYPFLSDSNVFLVQETLNALQLFAAHHRKCFSYPVIAISGSNGKTITKEWLYQLLREEKVIVRSPKSYNSQVGVPLSVLQMRSDHELAIFEAGISQPGEMERLKKIIEPDIGVFTNVGQAHNENFQNTEQKVQEKLKLFSNVSKLVYCKDYTDLENLIKQAQNKTEPFCWSRKNKADLVIGKITKDAGETEIQGVYKNDFIKIRIPFIDEASIENAIHCWSVMILLGIEQETIRKRMLMLTPVAMRLELKEGINNCSVINDTYNSDLGSLSIALDFLKQQKQHDRKTLILSDILQSGKDEAQLYAEVSDLIKQKDITRLIGVGEDIFRHAALFTIPAVFYNSTSDFIRQFNTSQFHNETILIKGARAFGFEAISQLLQQKAHETVLEINLTALINNVNYYRSKLRNETKIMAMVKAFSYGSGSFEIANVLQYNRVDYLAVAYADEGIELRKAGIQLPIMVMNPEEQSYKSMIKHNLEPEIFSIRVLTLFTEALKLHNTNNEQIPIHIKLDTGMHRLGFAEDELNELIVRIKNNRQLIVRSVFSHLAASDESEHDEFTRHQIKTFTKLSDRIREHIDYPFLRHILNSGGISRFTDAQFDMVRLGIGMYGVSNDPLDKLYLENVSTLKTTVSQIKNVSADKTIGYSRNGKLTRDTRIATIPIGYADGLSRRFGNGNGHMLINDQPAKTIGSSRNGKLTRDTRIATIPIGYADGLSRRFGNGNGHMLINDQPAKTIGSICMDMCMLDITDIVVKEGDEVIVFGEKKSLIEIAKEMDTIPYEVLTGISRRVKRVYFQE